MLFVSRQSRGKVRENIVEGRSVVEGDRWRTGHNWKDDIALEALDLHEFRLGYLNCI
jgi:hypothetical protein